MRRTTSARLAAQLSVLLAGTALGVGPSFGQTVGKAAAVNPSSTGVPPGGGSRVLRLGSEVVYKERIQTSASGSLQVLFLDKTTLNIGPNSDLVIDEYVYDPNTGTGRMTASLAKGVVRFVGGQVSHTGGATVRTPAASIGIRGGSATIRHTPSETREQRGRSGRLPRGPG